MPRAAPKGGRRFSLVCLLFATLFFSGPLLAGEEGSDDALLFLHARCIDDVWSFIEEWELRGARFPHIYPPDLVIGEVPAGLEAEIRTDGRVREFYRRPALLRPGKHAFDQQIIVRSWNLEEPDREETPSPSKGIHEGCLLLPPFSTEEPVYPKRSEAEAAKTYGRAFGADFFQTSEWLLGKVAVGVVLPKCPGGNYSIAELASIHEAVRGAFSFWAGQIPSPGVRFVYDPHNDVPCSRDFSVYPPGSEEALWVHEIMEHLGYTWSPKGLPAEPVYEYIDTLRTRWRTEWGLCVFVPKVPQFPSNYNGYGRLGGPYLVNASGISGGSGWLVGGEASLSHMIIHQVAHVFWALDEDCRAGQCIPCHVKAGYLGVINGNSLNRDYVCDPVHVPCCMVEPTNRVCKYTLGQMGIRDTPDHPNEEPDGILDVLDTHPFVYTDSMPDTVTTVFPVITGIAGTRPLPNLASFTGIGKGAEDAAGEPRNKITFNSIEHVIYRIDEMADANGNPLWLYADPRGGWGGDSTRLHFSFVPDSLTGGRHTITVRAVNTVGNTSNWEESRIDLFVKAIALHDFRAEPEYDGNVRVAFRVRGGTFGARGKLYRQEGDTPEVELLSFFLPEDEAMDWIDTTAAPGGLYEYRLEASALGWSWSWYASIQSPAPIRRGEFLSTVTPNPFRTKTVISYVVPRGSPVERGSRDGYKPYGEGAPSFAGKTAVDYAEVRVEVNIFNLAGRRVRSFPHVHAYEGIYGEPIVWDGLDDSGRRLPAGFYFVHLRAGDSVQETRKILLLP